MLSIGFLRFGRKGLPFYRIVIADKQHKSRGKYIKNIGFYSPTVQDANKQFSINREQYMEWIFKGAKPTKALSRLCKKFLVA